MLIHIPFQWVLSFPSMKVRGKGGAGCTPEFLRVGVGGYR